MTAKEFLTSKKVFHGLGVEEDNATGNSHKISDLMEEYHQAKLKLLGLAHISKSLPTKKYEIDFDGNVLAGIEISENTPKVFGAMNGYGNGIGIENIKITEK